MTEEEFNSLQLNDIVRRIKDTARCIGHSGEAHIIRRGPFYSNAWPLNLKCPTVSFSSAYVVETGLVICRPSYWELVGHMVNKAAPESRTEIIERRLDTEL